MTTRKPKAKAKAKASLVWVGRFTSHPLQEREGWAPGFVPTDISQMGYMVFGVAGRHWDAPQNSELREVFFMRKLCSDLFAKTTSRVSVLSAFAFVAFALLLYPMRGVAQSCTNMTGSVQGKVRVGSDGWVIGTLVNNSGQAVHVFYTFKQNGAPSNSMDNAGATNIGAGQTFGGEGQGLYSTSADKNPPEIYWYAVLKSDYDQNKSCSMAHRW
jgi:hypothetical protein